MGFRIILIVCLFGLICSCKSTRGTTSVFADDLQITRISKSVYIHKSYIELADGNRFPCNGMVIVDRKEALVLDTPTDESESIALIRYLRGNLGVHIVGVVINHFHEDCLGGILAFHHADIPTYAHIKTVALAKEQGVEPPRIGFDQRLEIAVGRKHTEHRFFGEAHSPDNIVSWFPDEKTLFGGCMVKSMNASRGNLADANTEAWPVTMKKIKEAYPNVSTVVPGHGQYGGPELLDYTIDLFSE